MTHAAREAQLFSIDDVTFIWNAQSTIAVLLDDGLHDEAARLVQRIRDERGAEVVREIVVDCGYGNPLGACILELAQFDENDENDVRAATIAESTAFARLSNDHPAAEFRARVQARESGWVRATRAIVGRQGHSRAPVARRSRTATAYRVAPARPGDDDRPRLASRLARLLARLRRPS